MQSGLFDGLNNDELQKLGTKIEFFDGVPEFFDQMKNHVLIDDDFKKHEIDVEIYIVSTGLRRMISGIYAHVESIREWLVFLVGDTLGRDDTLPS